MKENPLLKMEFDQLAYLDKLSDYHRLFYGVFELGQPQHTEVIETAAVAFNGDTGKIDFLINPDFFYRLGEKEQLFVICHEAMHVMLSHMDRTKKFKLDHEMSNIAQDIVINELLIKEFGFKKEELNFNFKPCFVDTVFSKDEIEKNNIEKGKSFEYYYNLLESLRKNENNYNGAETLDQHDQESQLGEQYSSIPQEVAQSVCRAAAQGLTEKEKKQVIESFEQSVNDASSPAGSVSLGSLFGITLDKAKQENRWIKIVKNKVASLLKKDRREDETFVRRPRRLTILDENMFLPEFLEEDKSKNDKFNLVFFLDASGSCIGYKDKFFNLARSIPKDKFNIILYSFDTSVYEIDINKPSVRGGGGTSFSILESAIQRDLKNKKELNGKYPDLVFVLTDGEGTRINPAKPSNWYWLLTSDATQQYIPAGSNIVSLNEFKNNNAKVKVTTKAKRF